MARNKVAFAISLSFLLISCDSHEKREPNLLGRLVSPDGAKEILLQAYPQYGISSAFVGVDLYKLRNSDSKFEERILRTLSCKNLKIQWLNDNTVGIDFDKLDSGKADWTKTVKLNHINVVNMKIIDDGKKKRVSIGVPDCMEALGLKS